MRSKIADTCRVCFIILHKVRSAFFISIGLEMNCWECIILQLLDTVIESVLRM